MKVKLDFTVKLQALHRLGYLSNFLTSIITNHGFNKMTSQFTYPPSVYPRNIEQVKGNRLGNVFQERVKTKTAREISSH